MLGFAPGTPASQIVERARAAGIKLSIAHVYSIRTAARARAKTRGLKAPAAPPARSVAKPIRPVSRPAPRIGSLEERYVDLCLDMGLARAGELLGRLRERVRAIALR
ncbi:MAG: hypothetical protein HY744_01460 [Deltaproteobacteria bacterium]|nr:hypothetical protein [Deltaproteobacteria bacterium]